MPPLSTPFDLVKDDHDDLVFLDEQVVPVVEGPHGAAWRIMIVDDDDVHLTTTMCI